MLCLGMHFDQVLDKTRHVFVKHGCPRQQQSQNMAKIFKSDILTPPHPQGHRMSVKCEEPLNELTVQVWLLYLHPNFYYWTFWAPLNYGQTDRRTDIQTNDPITRCPRWTFQTGGIKKILTNIWNDKMYISASPCKILTWWPNGLPLLLNSATFKSSWKV